MTATIDLRPESREARDPVESVELVRSGWVDQAERWLSVAVPFALFCCVGWRAAVVAGNLPGDSLSRAANASSAVLSRDPHLESIGFVWSPFPTLFQVPLANLARIWPEVVSRGLGAVVVSAWLMTWMLAVVRRWLGDIGLPRLLRIALVALLTLHPFILLYGSNGMSEAGMLCFLVLAARRLALWFETDRPIELARVGVALGFGYLTRYEVAAAIVAVMVLVAVVSHAGATGMPKQRRREAALRVAVVGIPAMFAVVLWSLVSWAIVDEPFAQFSSKYGNSQLVRAGSAGIIRAVGSIDGMPRVVFFLQQLAVVGAIGALALVVLVWWGTKYGLRIWAAIFVLGAPLGFQLMTAFAGSSFAWGRYVISVVPLTVLLVGVAAVNLTGRQTNKVGVEMLAIVLVAAASLIGLALCRSGSLETQDERGALAALPKPYGTDRPAGRSTTIFLGDRIAADIDALHPRRGEVLTDTAAAFAIVINAADQTDYVIPADRDFERVNSDPGLFGVRYLLVPDPKVATYNAVNAENPTLFENGGGIATLVKEWSGNSQTPRFRLYELNPDQRIGGK